MYTFSRLADVTMHTLERLVEMSIYLEFNFIGSDESLGHSEISRLDGLTLRAGEEARPREAQIRALSEGCRCYYRGRGIRDESDLTSQASSHRARQGFRELVRTVEAGPQDGPADAGSIVSFVSYLV
ncbi:hypothetical protein Tco_0751590 [Tanacetum coccineum]|uniref:Uncharacterized protein n=1 Tax=Tanacetum coccineum TaxID=301880 RepID=A0ABQ4Z4F7_9ASTR